MLALFYMELFRFKKNQKKEKERNNEKTFRDRGYRITWDNSLQTRDEKDKTKFEAL